MVGSYQFSLMAGGLVINLVCFGTSNIQDNRSWRIPIGLFYIVPSIVLSLIFFIPESPRWLLRKNRVDEALVNLRLLRQGRFSEEEIESEFRELRVSLEQEVEKGRFIEIFQGGNLERTLIAVVVNMLQQLTGQGFSSQYGTIYVKSLNTINPFAFSLITLSVALVIMTASLLWADHAGRRFVFPQNAPPQSSAFTNTVGQGSSLHFEYHHLCGHDGHGRTRCGDTSLNREEKWHCGHDDCLRYRLRVRLGTSPLCRYE